MYCSNCDAAYDEFDTFCGICGEIIITKHDQSKAKFKEKIDLIKEEKLYELAMDELANGSFRKGIWAKAVAKSNGNNNQAQSIYIELRVESLKCDAHGESLITTEIRDASAQNLFETLDQTGDGLEQVLSYSIFGSRINNQEIGTVERLFYSLSGFIIFVLVIIFALFLLT